MKSPFYLNYILFLSISIIPNNEFWQEVKEGYKNIFQT